MNILKTNFMRQFSAFFLLLMATMPACRAYDFAQATPSGHSLYYAVSDSLWHEVTVVWPNSKAERLADLYDGFTKPSGHL